MAVVPCTAAELAVEEFTCRPAVTVHIWKRSMTPTRAANTGIDYFLNAFLNEGVQGYIGCVVVFREGGDKAVDDFRDNQED